MKINALFLLATIFASCENPFIRTSESQSMTTSDTESDSQSISESVSEVDPIDVTLLGEYVTSVFNQGEIINLSKEEKNYLVLKDGHVLFTVGMSKSFDDTYASCIAYDEILTSCFKNNSLTIPSSCQGYELTNDGYSALLSAVTDGILKYNVTDLALWNLPHNGYFDDELSISFEGEFAIVSKLTSINDEAFRLSSIYDEALNDSTIYKMVAPYTDSYKLSCTSASEINVYDSNYKKISTGTTSVTPSLNKDDICYVELNIVKGTTFTLQVTPTNYKTKLPYDIYDTVDASNVSLTSNNTVSTYKACDVSYTKRQNDGRGLYVNCNNPEIINAKDLNQALTRQDVTDKKVFFTFEHNNYNGQSYYYGYRVTNTGNSDVYITVENLGYQVSGQGTWLGEDEWIKFYNLNFRESLTGYSSSQLSNYEAYVDFSNSYQQANRQPITYRIPKGQYIYVMGGTSADAYKKIDVFNSADIKVKGSCGNGAVIFDVHGGSAEGSFLLYTSASTINATSSVTSKYQQGYIALYSGTNYGSQYVGSDDCHGVVDASFLYTFNDATADQDLGINFDNNLYVPSASRKGTAYSKITSFSPYKARNCTSWVTHINPNVETNAVGTDMTYYKTYVNDLDDFFTFDPTVRDGKGNSLNIGNWMVDYQDNFTFVNQGNSARKITISLSHNGVILAFLRNSDGTVLSSVGPGYYTMINSSNYGDALYHPFTFTFTIQAHSMKKFTLDYNLLANSCGYISHTVTLSK